MFSNLKILVIGDIMLDHYIWGDATRISPEAPVPVVSVDRDSYVPGGAANVACNLAGLGVKTVLLGRYGPDDGGNRLGSLLSERSIELPSLGCASRAATIVKTRVVVQRQQMCRIDRELSLPDYRLADALTPALLAKLLDGIDAVLISDYAKGVVDDELLALLRGSVSGAPGVGASVTGLPETENREPNTENRPPTTENRPTAHRPLLIIDPKPKRALDLSGMDLMTPNRVEALQLAGLPADPHAPFDDEQVCAAIHQRFAPRNLVITLGSEGMLLCRDGAILGRLPTEAREVFDVSGAGDTVVATLTAALAAGQSLEDAAKLANKAAGIVVSHLGTSPISAEALFR